MSSSSAPKPKPKRQKTTALSSSFSGPARSSLRLKGLAPDGTTIALSLPQTADEISEERRVRVVECREARLRAAKEVASAGADKAEMENPTASYAHCLMRVKTMSEKALATRVKRIENAAGKHCIGESERGAKYEGC